MIDTASELDVILARLASRSVVPLAQLAGELPCRRGGRKTHVSTLYHWTTTGCRWVRPPFVQIGATRCTSREALAHFFGRLTRDGAKAPASPAPHSTRAARRREQGRVDRRLDSPVMIRPDDSKELVHDPVF